MPAPATSLRQSSRAHASAAAAEQRGVALVLTLIFAILLYILVAELVVMGRMVRATGENDALLARMRTQMLFQMRETEDQLLADNASQAEGGDDAGGGGLGALGGALGGAAGQAGGAGGVAPEGEGAAEDPSAGCDSSRDAWFHPTAHADNDLTTYVFVEDENRKFNILALWSPDEKFAEFSRDRMVRLLDALREDTEFDISSGDAGRIVQDLLDWGRRQGSDAMPRPRLKTEDPKRREIAAPMHLDEMLLLPSVTEDLFFDKVLDGRVYLGLESVLTMWTSVRVDPGNPEKAARLRAAAIARGENPPDAAPGEGGSGQAGGANGSTGSQAGGAQAGGGQANSGQAGAEDAPPQPEGLGIRINVNTASRPVLRALFPPEVIPDRVIDAIIKYRNEVDEDAQRKAEEASGSGDGATTSDFGDLRLETDVKRKFFAEVADLEKVEDFAKIADPEVKTKFQNALTTKSEVFSIHLATMFKRNEENRVYVLRRARSIVLRIDDGADGKIVPLVPFEDRIGLRLQPIDIQEVTPDLAPLYMNIDQFAQEERAWNPFLIDFYLPRSQRADFYRPR